MAGRPKQHSEEVMAEAVADYLAGEHSYDIALSIGVSNPTILNWVRAAGHRVRTAQESRALDRARRSS